MKDPYALRKKLADTDRDECDDALLSCIDGWLKRLDGLEGLKAVSSSSVIQDMVKRRTEEIKGIETRLLETRDMGELERKNLLDRRDLYREFVDSFDVDKSLEKLSEEIDENL